MQERLIEIEKEFSRSFKSMSGVERKDIMECLPLRYSSILCE